MRLVHAFSARLPHRALPTPASTACWRWFRLRKRADGDSAPLRHSSRPDCFTALNSRASAMALAAHSFAREDEITFGAGANETPLTAENEALCRELCARSSTAATPTARTPIRSSACSPSAGLSRDCAPDSENCYPPARRPALLPGSRAFQRRSRHARSAHPRSQRPTRRHRTQGRRRPAPALQALDYWIRVRALNADRQPAAGSDRPFRHSSARDTFPQQRSRQALHDFCLPPPPCASIPPTSPSCAIFLPRLSGS